MNDELIPDFLTSSWLSAALGAEVRGFTATRIGDGLVGMNLRLQLDAEPGAPATLVIKLPSPDPTSRATGIALRNYEREVRFYREVASTVDVRAAACHSADWDPDTGEFHLLLEDLAPGAQGNQIVGCSVGQARTAVLELARLHGPRWDDPTLADLDWLQRRTTADDTAALVSLWQLFVPGFLSMFSRYLDTEQVELVERFGSRLADWVDGHVGPLTVTHGDYRLDNLMFATELGGSPIAVVDWQTPGHGTALSDVSYFLGAGLLSDERRRVERTLVDEYAEALAAYQVEVDEEWLWRQYCRDAFGGVIMSVVASQVVGVSERSEAMFAAMATRHTQHALDLDSLSLV
ncbi:MAG: hypothetical protein RI958_763 [Actinomycetota bacterium]|jgi:hypothetical protein